MFTGKTDYLKKRFITVTFLIVFVKKMVKRKGFFSEGREHLLGAWAFLIGVILAVVLGIFSSRLGDGANSSITGLLVIAGILVGLLNIGNRNSRNFLLAAVSLVIVSYMGSNVISALEGVAIVGPILRDTLSALLVLFIPATIIVALKIVFELAHN